MSKVFKHSVKVPRLYKTAAKIIQKVKEEGHSLKDQVYQYSHCNTKALYALVVKALQNGDTLDYILRTSKILHIEKRIDPWLARALITELIWGSKRLPTGNKPCDTILKYSEEFLKILENSNETFAKSNLPNSDFRPRYVRVNTLKISIEEAIDSWTNDGWTQLFYESTSYNSYLEALQIIGEYEFLNDFHIPELFAFAPKTEFHSTQLYQNGSIILQDKSSCVPAYLLSPPPGSIIMDMCAAPGMKTSHLAAIMKNKGKIYAIEKNERRFKILQNLMNHYGATCVEPVNMDALQVSEKQFPDVEYILLDPSCTGSGRADFDNPNTTDKDKLHNLTTFQTLLLEQAFSLFPNLKKITYSTCSCNREENEDVVAECLKFINAQGPVFKIESNTFSSWNHFGDKNIFPGAEHCLYTKPDSDFTGSFFVALFKRINQTSTDMIEHINSIQSARHESNNILKWETIKINDEILEKKKNKKRKNKSNDSEQFGETSELKIYDAPISKTKKKKKSNLEVHLKRLLASSEEEDSDEETNDWVVKDYFMPS